MKKQVLTVGLLVVFMFLLSNSIFAHSFELYDQGRAAQAQAGAFTAQADDPTAVYYNPAAVSKLEGNQILAGTNIIWLKTKYTSPDGATAEDNNDVALVPTLYATSDLGIDKWGFGIGVYSGFGLCTKYQPDGLLRYFGYETELRTIYVNPVVSYQVTEKLSLGAGLSYVDAHYDHKRKVDFGALAGMPGAFDGDYHIDADADGWAWNVGVFFQPAEKHSLGLIYRSKVELDFSGNHSLSGLPSFISPLPELSTGATASFDLPDILRAGYAYRPTPEWKIEVDFEYTFFDEFKTLDVVSADPALVPGEEQIRNWENGWTLGIGTEYWLNENWVLRAGYGHTKASVPVDTYDANVPGADKNLFQIGAGYVWKNITINGVLQYAVLDDVDVTDSPNTAPGTYETDAFAIGLEGKIAF